MLRAINEVTEIIIGEAIALHRELGPGLLESTYESCLVWRLRRRGLEVERQVAMPLVYHGELLEGAYRLDLLVEQCVIVELKTVAKLDPVHFAQLATYLRLSHCEVGLLINFNVTRLLDGLRRLIRQDDQTLSPLSVRYLPPLPE